MLIFLLFQILYPAETEIKALPDEFINEIDSNKTIMNVIGIENWKKIVDVSQQVKEEGLFGIAEEKYLPFSKQRKLFWNIHDSKVIPEDIKLVLQDIVIQYYFFTYYYYYQNPRQQGFIGKHKEFLKKSGIEYTWVEPAGQNYYLHTFLKQLIERYPDTQWGKYYSKIYEETGFNEIKGEEEESCTCFTAEVFAGQTFEKPFGPGFLFRLEPDPFGWLITLKYGNEDISRLTPPWHFVPSPREIEGWHFRNSDNTGPNETGEKNVNAPGEVREFIFSPEVGKTIDGPQANQQPTPEEIKRIKSFGRGTLTILDYRLTNVEPGKQASFEWMRFYVELFWFDSLQTTE